jgi:DNA invertase Pin-like site-specific DNA recombinase
LGRYVIAKYIRLSIEDGKNESLSVESQRLILDKHIAELCIPNAEILEFVDNGHSGTNFERPAVQELLELVRQGKINCIIVKDLSRFGRSMIETGYYIECVFPLFRIRFIAVLDHHDSAEHEGDTGGMDIAFKFLIHE